MLSKVLKTNKKSLAAELRPNALRREMEGSGNMTGLAAGTGSHAVPILDPMTVALHLLKV